MKDILEDDSEKFIYFIKNASKIANNFGFSYIQTPILEETSLFKRSVGESSDIVGKEMYQFIDKGQNDVCLRPEGTAGVVRSFIEHKFDRAGGIRRYYYYGPMFRYERPQKGRLRQFHQFGVESFGEKSVYEDANIIIMIAKIFDFFNITYKVKLNSLGCNQCMPNYKEKLISYLKGLELCKDCQRRTNLNPIRTLDCKNLSCQEKLKNAPKITKHLCNECQNDFNQLQQILTTNQIQYEIDTNLVRGLDYYTKTAFEFISEQIGAQSAIAGGGRYDRLVEFLGGKPTPAVGFAIGIERILELIQIPNKQEPIYYFGAMDEKALNLIHKLANDKRNHYKTISEFRVRGFSKHINSAIKLGANIICLIGENELKNNTIWIKDILHQKEYHSNLNYH
jgi:histidyl-tRNA synthetase